MNADQIIKMQCREARAAGAKEVGKALGNVLAGIIIGAGLMAGLLWLVWLLWLAASTSWTVLVSPGFMAVAELVIIALLVWLWRVFHPRPAAAIPE